MIKPEKKGPREPAQPNPEAENVIEKGFYPRAHRRPAKPNPKADNTIKESEQERGQHKGRE